MGKVYTYLNNKIVDPKLNDYTHVYDFSIKKSNLHIMLFTVINKHPINIPLILNKKILEHILTSLEINKNIKDQNVVDEIVEDFPNVKLKYIPALFDLYVIYINQSPPILSMN